MILKDLNIKTLVSGDKSARVVLETTDPEDVNELAKLSGETFVRVTFDKVEE